MKRSIYAVLLIAFATATANAQAPQQSPQPSGSAAQILASIPANSVTITHWYKQNVYDPSDNKIGEIMDVLVDRAGKATALIIGVGGFLGMGEKDVAVPFDAVQVASKDNATSTATTNCSSIRSRLSDDQVAMPSSGW